MNRTEKFENLYNDLVRYFRQELDRRGQPTRTDDNFGTLLNQVSQFNRAVRNRRSELQEIAHLRNAIAHSRGRNGIQYIAEPHREVVDELQSLVDQVLRPQRADDVCVKGLQIFKSSDGLDEALRLMEAKKYSQILVQDEGTTRFLSLIGIKNWLAHHVQHGFLIIEKVTISEVLEHEPRETYDFVARDVTIDELRERFATIPSVSSERIQALIVTNSGRDSETPIGILTPSDVVT